MAISEVPSRFCGNGSQRERRLSIWLTTEERESKPLEITLD
jgi:hypothetical protein